MLGILVNYMLAVDIAYKYLGRHRFQCLQAHILPALPPGLLKIALLAASFYKTVMVVVSLAI